MNRTYTPKPINTSTVELPSLLLPLVELLAESNHDVWAQGRFREGWTHGERRNDVAKHNPCLVPYLDLPDSEKQYDRNSVTETLKAIIALGYRIEKR